MDFYVLGLKFSYYFTDNSGTKFDFSAFYKNLTFNPYTNDITSLWLEVFRQISNRTITEWSVGSVVSILKEKQYPLLFSCSRTSNGTFKLKSICRDSGSRRSWSTVRPDLYQTEQAHGNILTMDRIKVRLGRNKDFNDSEWKSGAAPLGYPESEKHGTFGNIATVIDYGGDSQNKHATSYFRTTFEVEDLSKISTSGLITAGIDDSAIIYLNGNEIARFNLPEGEDIKFDDYVQDFGLNDASESSDKTFRLTEEQMSYIVEGTNVLAAEVHQDRPSSSDVFFDMEFKSIYVDPTSMMHLIFLLLQEQMKQKEISHGILQKRMYQVLLNMQK